MQSSTALRPTTNPYLKQLYTSVGEHVDLTLFSWREALLGRFDVLHLHWPELLVRGSNGPRTAARQLATLLLLIRIRGSRRVLVRTVHNVEPHEIGGRAEQLLLRLVDRWTTLYVLLTPGPVPRTGAPAVVIPHGHYISWFAGMHIPPSTPGVLLHPGLLRPYKGVDELLSAFSHLGAAELRLRIVGKAESKELADQVVVACQHDARITAVLHFVPDEEMAAEIGRAQVVVLPYRNMHNSGMALLSLSLNRPVLTPRNATTEALAREVGDRWVRRYDAPLTAQDLADAALATASLGNAERPDLSGRTWPATALAHMEAYRAAIDLERRR